jgi:hypothetical protein
MRGGSPAIRRKTKNHLLFNGLASFEATVDCAAVNNRLKRRRYTSSQDGFGFAPEFALKHQNQDDFLDAKHGRFA